MKPVTLGSLQLDQKLIYVEETPPNQEQLQVATSFTVSLRIGQVQVELDLDELRQLKRLLNEGERHLLLRHDQATRAKNYSLDL